MPAAPRRSRAATPRPRSRISREQADERRRQALAIITENPGTTASNLALLLDTSTGTMHSLLKRLEAEGEIEKAEKGLRAEGRRELTPGRGALARADSRRTTIATDATIAAAPTIIVERHLLVEDQRADARSRSTGFTYA